MIVPDESGWRVGGEGAWLWVATSTGATCYWVAGGRDFDEALEMPRTGRPSKPSDPLSNCALASRRLRPPPGDGTLL